MYNNIIIFTMLTAYKNRHINNYSIYFITNKLIKGIYVAKSTLYEWIKKYDIYDLKIEMFNEKRVMKRKSNNKIITIECEKYICGEVIKNPVRNVKKLVNDIYDIFSIDISARSIRYVLKKNNITYKTVQFNNRPIDKHYDNKIIQVYEDVKKVDNNFLSIDETSIELFSKPNKGYAKKGKRCVIHKSNKRKHYSLLTAINKNKIVKFLIVSGSINGEIFLNFIKDLPKKPLFMDNARIHHYHKLKKYSKEHNINIIYNVPYSPQFNPIEYYHNTLKKEIYQTYNDSYDKLLEQITKCNNNLHMTGFKKYYEKTFDNLKSAFFEIVNSKEKLSANK